MFKKIALVAILLASAAFAQVSVGEHASFTFGTLWGDRTEDANWGAGFTAGFDFKAQVNKKLSFVAELEVDYRRITKDYELASVEYDYTFFLWYLRLPAMARFYLDPKIFGELGMTAAVRLCSGEMNEVDGDGQNSFRGAYHSADDMYRFEVGLIAGFGFVITPKVDFNMRYSMGITNMASQSNNGTANMRFQAGLTYWFN